MPAAIKPLTRTIALGGGDGKVFGLLGFAYASVGRNVSAEAAYRQALVFEPENLDFKLGLVKSAVATANYDYALALLDELIREYPERDNLWTLQANLYIQKEQPAKAASAWKCCAGPAKPPRSRSICWAISTWRRKSRDLALGAYLEGVRQGQRRRIRPRPCARRRFW